MAARSDDTFEIGFALAGAISAGAYTAGILDFFFQALNEWEKARNAAGTPGHRVSLQVITGASAGAITGALGVVALARGMRRRN
jgi:predicted acylesterase/phospholipase RssA